MSVAPNPAAHPDARRAAQLRQPLLARAGGCERWALQTTEEK